MTAVVAISAFPFLTLLLMALARAERSLAEADDVQAQVTAPH